MSEIKTAERFGGLRTTTVVSQLSGGLSRNGRNAG